MANWSVPILHRSDQADGGAFQLTVTVDELGVTGPYPVTLFDRASRRPLRSGITDANGVIVFQHIAYRERGYFAIAFDHGGDPLNAAIADMLTPEPMP